MKPASRDYELNPGYTFGPYVYTMLDSNGRPVDLTGATPYWHVKDAVDGTLEIDLAPVILTSGVIGDFTASDTTDLLTLTAHGLQVGYAVTFSSSGTLPAPLDSTLVYYVIPDGLTADDFMVSLTPDGLPVDITDTGTGTHTATLMAGQLVLPEITDETSHDWVNAKWFHDLMIEFADGKRMGRFIAGKFNIVRVITNPDE